MNDIIVQFAMLWGQTIGSAITPEEIAKAKEMKQYDSEELLKLLSGWAEEYLNGDFDDTVDFFNNKVNNPIKPADFAKTAKAIAANKIAIAAIQHGIFCDLDILTEYWDNADDYFMETYGCTVEEAENALDCKFAIRGNWGNEEASDASEDDNEIDECLVENLPKEFSFKSKLNPCGALYFAKEEDGYYIVTCDAHSCTYMYTKQDFHKKIRDGEYVVCD